MRVVVHREIDVGMPHQVLRQLGMYVGAGQVGPERMSQRVEVRDAAGFIVVLQEARFLAPLSLCIRLSVFNSPPTSRVHICPQHRRHIRHVWHVKHAVP